MKCRPCYRRPSRVDSGAKALTQAGILYSPLGQRGRAGVTRDALRVQTGSEKGYHVSVSTVLLLHALAAHMRIDCDSQLRYRYACPFCPPTSDTRESRWGPQATSTYTRLTFFISTTYKRVIKN